MLVHGSGLGDGLPGACGDALEGHGEEVVSVEPFGYEPALTTTYPALPSEQPPPEPLRAFGLQILAQPPGLLLGLFPLPNDLFGSLPLLL